MKMKMLLSYDSFLYLFFYYMLPKEHIIMQIRDNY